MKTKQEIIAEFAKGVVLDVGYAQEPNSFLTDAYGIDIARNCRNAHLFLTSRRGF